MQSSDGTENSTAASNSSISADNDTTSSNETNNDNNKKDNANDNANNIDIKDNTARTEPNKELEGTLKAQPDIRTNKRLCTRKVDGKTSQKFNA